MATPEIKDFVDSLGDEETVEVDWNGEEQSECSRIHSALDDYLCKHQDLMKRVEQTTRRAEEIANRLTTRHRKAHV